MRSNLKSAVSLRHTRSTPCASLSDKSIETCPGPRTRDRATPGSISLLPRKQACAQAIVRRFRTGLAVAIPSGYAGFVQARSGRAVRERTRCGKRTRGYRLGLSGEIKVIAINLDRTTTVEIKRGDRIAQLVILRVERAELEVVDALPPSERGAGGHGVPAVRWKGPVPGVWGGMIVKFLRLPTSRCGRRCFAPRPTASSRHHEETAWSSSESSCRFRSERVLGLWTSTKKLEALLGRSRTRR